MEIVVSHSGTCCFQRRGCGLKKQVGTEVAGASNAKTGHSFTKQEVRHTKLKETIIGYCVTRFSFSGSLGETNGISTSSGWR